MSVVLYTSPTCGYCHQARAYLSQRRIQYVEKDVSIDRSAADEMIRLTGQMGVPVIVVDGRPIVGFNRPMLDKLLANGGAEGKPHFGLKIADVSKITQKPGAVPVFGAYVGQVIPGSLGQKAGLASGDIITELNMRSINTAADLERALGALMPGGKVSIVFMRGSKSLRSQITV